MTARARGILVAVLVAIASIGFVASASAASSAKTCKTVTVVTHVRHRTVRRRERICETAKISLSSSGVSSSGGAITIHYAATYWNTCTLGATPAFWSGRNPARVACRSSYTAHIPATVDARHWTFRFIAHNRYGELASVTIALSQQALQQPVVQFSTNWSGYMLEGTGLYAAQGTFNVPTLSPTTGDSRVAEWVGIDGTTNNQLIQAGVSEIYDSVGNDVIIYPWWEILPAAETPIGSLVVSARDSITVTIEQISGSNWGIRIVDNTTAQSFTTQQTYTGPETSAEWILEAPTVGGNIAQLGVFSPNVTYSGLAANGNKVLVDQLFMVQNDAIVSSPSALDANGFTVAYGPNPPPAP